VEKIRKIFFTWFVLFSFFLPLATFADEGYKLSPGDVIILTVFAGGKEQNNSTLTVSREGMASVPFLGDVPASDLSLSDFSKKIKEALAQDYFVDPVVNVTVKEYRGKQALSKVYVLGRVKDPKAYDYQEGLTALNACALAGGFDPFAAPNRATITRKKAEKEEIIKINLEKIRDGKEPDPLLLPGDRIYVPESRL